MTDKERAVISEVIDWVEENPHKSHGWIATRLRYALETEQENDMEYKWLAMDESGVATLHSVRPEIKNRKLMWLSGADAGVEDSPSFLLPLQLWERTCRVSNKNVNEEWIFSFADGIRYSWNNYWWRLVEDNSRPVADDNPWITDRRPTEDDADKWGFVLCWEDDELDFYSWQVVADNNWPWQPTPQCLRVKPVETKCEECIWFQLVERKDLGNTYRICLWCERGPARYGMIGCKFEKRKSGGYKWMVRDKEGVFYSKERPVWDGSRCEFFLEYSAEKKYHRIPVGPPWIEEGEIWESEDEERRGGRYFDGRLWSRVDIK